MSCQRWHEYFKLCPEPAFESLVIGLFPMGDASMLSLGEILDCIFEPGDAALDAASVAWLGKHILKPVPANISVNRWTHILDDYFHGIRGMKLPLTERLMIQQSDQIRSWLHFFYDGPDRDPEGAFLLALAKAKKNQNH